MPTRNAGLSGPNPIVGDGTLTVSTLVNRPQLYVRQVQQLFAANYWANRLLPNGGGAPSGAVEFFVVDHGSNFPDRDVEERAENAEAPILNSTNPDPKLARATEYSGAVYITDKAIRRNDLILVSRDQAKLANAMARRFHSAAVAAVTSAVTTYNRSVPVGVKWSTITPNGNSATTFFDWPHTDIINAQATSDALDDNLVYNLLLVHPNEWARLSTIYEGDLSRLWPDGTSGSVIPTNLIADGSPLLVAEGQAGQTQWELAPVTEKVDERRKFRTLYQTTGAPLYFVDQPNAVVQFTGTI